MTSPTTEQVTTIGVVTIGLFNPAIIHPSWLASEGLISKAEADGAITEVVHPDVAQFSLKQSGAVLRVQALRDRLNLTTDDARFYEMTRDLSVGVLTLLRHTPVTKLGINCDSHLALASADARDALGKKFAPPTPWKGIVDGPLLLGLSMKASRPDKRHGHVMVRIEPSPRTPFGVLVGVNDHYDLDAEATGRPGAELAIEILKSNWDSSFKRSREIVSKVMT